MSEGWDKTASLKMRPLTHNCTLGTFKFSVLQCSEPYFQNAGPDFDAEKVWSASLCTIKKEIWAEWSLFKKHQLFSHLWGTEWFSVLQTETNLGKCLENPECPRVSVQVFAAKVEGLPWFQYKAV